MASTIHSTVVMTTIHDLPVEVLRIVFEQLFDPILEPYVRGFRHMIRVCKAWKQVVTGMRFIDICPWDDVPFFWGFDLSRGHFTRRATSNLLQSDNHMIVVHTDAPCPELKANGKTEEMRKGEMQEVNG